MNRGWNGRLRALVVGLGVAVVLSALSWAGWRARAASTLTVTNNQDAGPGSLRNAIASAASGDTILLQVTGAIELVTTTLVINKDLNIVGPGANNLTLRVKSIAEHF